MTKEELKQKLKFLEKEVQKIWDRSFEMQDGWNWYKNNPTLKECIETEREYKLIQDYTLRPQDDFGDLIPLEDFVEYCKKGFFSDYDGSGVYVTNSEQSDIYINPTDILADKYRKDFTHVKWYNK